MAISELISEFNVESSNQFEERLSRLMLVAKASGPSDLAKVLEINPSSVAAAKKRQQIPTGWIEKIATTYSANANWLFFGEGPMYRGDEIAAAGQADQRPSSEEVCPRCAKLKNQLEELRQEQRKERERCDELVQRLLQASDRLEEVGATVLRLTQDNAELRIQLARAAPEPAEANRKSA
ncbi:CI repressor [Oleidesulfovibrio alaskensis G20]|uniref:CI repressor n=1 Tax=Oleidesulfovibrio alaskensis (strain ATCC BAA-1058 / DSM 17464 / G20) TaxID=207559 RepID=Q312W5_OLEA2|nr:CI repressor [Oleidesulfovibrio alaskensis G20]